MASVSFRGSAERIPFNPLRAPDTSDQLRQQLNQQMSWRREDQQMILQNRRDIAESMRDQNRINQQARLQDLENLGQFSQSLSNIVVGLNQQRQEAQEIADFNRMYEQGLPEEITRAYDQQEAQVLANDQSAVNMAASAEQLGASTDVVKEVRKSGGYRTLGETRALLEMASAAYPSFYNDAAEKASVLIDGREVTLATAKNTAERAAVESVIRSTWIRRFRGLNPAAINKYLYPGMQRFEAMEAANWARQQRDSLKVTRLEEAKDELLSAIQGGNGGERFIELINRRAADFGGLGAARGILRDVVFDLVKKKVINAEQVQNLLGYQFQANDGQVTTIGLKFERDFAGIEDELNNAARSELQQELQDEQDRKARFMLDFNDLVRQREQEGRPVTEGELLALTNKFRADVGPNVPDEILNYLTREDRDDEIARQTILAKRQTQGFITEKDLAGVSPTLYSELSKLVKEDENITAPSKAFLADAKAKAAAITDERFQSERGLRDKTPGWVDFNRRAFADYKAKYMRYVRAGDEPSIAHEKALKNIEDNAKVRTYDITPSLSASSPNGAKLKRIQFLLSANPDSVTNTKLPGLEAEIQALSRWRETGKGDVPTIFKNIALDYRDLHAWDIASAQYRLYTGSELVKPRAVLVQDSSDPAVRRLLNTSYATPARVNRAAVLNGGWKPFLDLIASQESTSFGGYDAMNTGGSSGGTVAYGSANSNDVFGRGLSQMTIADVMRLQSQGKVHAAGRYQIIQSTLGDLMTNSRLKSIHQLTPDMPFNAANQDRLAVALARRRMINNEGLAGMRNEWVGLRKISDRVLQNAISKLSQSPFNQPENLHPSLVYRIGNLGYGSTGPHLDVKPVAPGTTSTTGARSIKGNELDQYVLVGPNRKPLSQGTVTTDDDRAHRNRGSYGHDFAAPDGTPVFLVNGARVVGSSTGDQGTDHLIIELPDGRRYQFLHGKRA